MDDFEMKDNMFQQAGMNNQDAMPPKPENYLVWAILSTLCCCLPFGIVAIIKACKVNTLYAARMYEAAQLASQDAKKWCIIAAITGVVIQIIYGILYALGIVASLYNL